MNWIGLIGVLFMIDLGLLAKILQIRKTGGRSNE